MKTLTLKILAFIACMLCGFLATLAMLNMEAEGVRLVLAIIVSIGCLPLGLFIAYSAYKEHKEQAFKNVVRET